MARRSRNYWESSAYGSWRHMIASLQRAGVRKKTKRMSHQQDRAEAKREILAQQRSELAAYETMAVDNREEDWE